MHAPQIVLIVLFFVSLTLSFVDHGKEKKGKENCLVNLIATSVTLAILIWGGFFN